jgi:protein required for attachment to host cells
LKVVAAPRFLGYLRQAWSPQVAGTISDELDKDLVKADFDELEKRLLPAHA